MEFNGLPLHPLLVHAAVMLAPMAALTGWAYAARPSWRWALRWPLLALAGSAALAITATYLSGRDLLDARFGGQPVLPDYLTTHQDRAGLLLIATWAFLGCAALGAWALGGTTALASGRGTRPDHATWRLPALVLLALGGAAVLVLTFLTGDAGARAVWG